MPSDLVACAADFSLPSVVTTLDAGAQRVAMDLLGQQGSPGAVVAI